MKADGKWIEGSFSCTLCRRSYDMEVKLRTNGGQSFLDMHNSVHVADFFNYVFQDEMIRKAFFNYNKNKLTIALLQSGTFY